MTRCQGPRPASLPPAPHAPPAVPRPALPRRRSYVLVVDLRGRVHTFLQHRDVNLAHACRPDDVEPPALRKLLLGALRYGAPRRAPPSLRRHRPPRPAPPLSLLT